MPHHYTAKASAETEGPIVISSEGLEPLTTAAPAQFGGPGDLWSPETLIVGAVANCFVLTFRAITRASRFEWLALRCTAAGTLDRVDRVTRFTEIVLRVELTVSDGADAEKARRLLEKAEKTCLVTNSLVCPVRLEADVGLAFLD